VVQYYICNESQQCVSGERPEAPDVSNLTVSINVDVVMVADDVGQNEFYCDIDDIETLNSAWLYRVAWVRTSKLSVDRDLYQSFFVHYEDETQFRNTTALTEVHLEEGGIYRMGFTVC